MRAKRLLTGTTILIIWLLSSGLAVSAEIENLVGHGDFEFAADMGQWNWDAQDVAGSMIIDKKDAATGKASLFIEILDMGGAAAHRPNPSYNERFTLKKGETYTFSACLKAEEERGIVMKVRQFEVWTVCSQKTVRVGTEWEEYHLTFTSQEDVQGLAGLCFNNTGSETNYWIDNVWFYEGEYEPTLPVVKRAVTATGKLLATWAAIRTQY